MPSSPVREVERLSKPFEDEDSSSDEDPEYETGFRDVHRPIS